MLRIKLVKSPIGNTSRNRKTVAALGLRKVQQVVEMPDNGSVRGMIHHVQHLVTFEVVEGDAPVKIKLGKAAKASRGEVAAAPKVKKAPAKAQPKAVEAKPKKAETKPKVAAEKPAKAPAKAKKSTEEKA